MLETCDYCLKQDCGNPCRECRALEERIAQREAAQCSPLADYFAEHEVDVYRERARRKALSDA